MPKKERKKIMKDIPRFNATLRHHILQFPEHMRGRRMLKGLCLDWSIYVTPKMPTYFVSTPELVELLHSTTMNVDMEYLEPFPAVCCISWPVGAEVEGIGLQPVACRYGSNRKREDIWGRFCREVLGMEPRPVDETEAYLSDCILDTLCATPNDKLSGWAIGHTGGGKLTEWIKGDCDQEFKEDSEESLVKEVTPSHQMSARLAARLLVYIQACPECVIPGWPGSVRKMDKGYNKVPSVIGLPEPKEKTSTKGSPTDRTVSTHWRNWHFRSYPRRKDGTRNRGVVRVSGCVVGADKIDPKTVVEP